MSDDDKPIAKFLRLRNGDDVISEVVEIEDDKGIRYTLFHPLKIVYVPIEESGYLSINFMPWVFPRVCDIQEFTIDEEDIMFIEDVSKKMNTYYWESIDSYINNTPEKKEEREQSNDQVEETNDMLPEEELELFKKIMDHMGTKRTFH